jgi:molecular chaperone GrpE (heat shock protein)
MSGYLTRLKDALLARAPAPAPALAPVLNVDRETPESESQLRAQLAILTLDVEDRDHRIESMRREYAALEDARDRATTDACQQLLERLFKRLASPLSNLAALADLSENAQEVAVSDLLHLFRNIEKELARAGLERIGAAGQTASFDSTIHQRMSGGSVHIGTPVVVRVPGYRMAEKVLMKAMVTTREVEG